jgi:hypothetical protein
MSRVMLSNWGLCASRVTVNFFKQSAMLSGLCASGVTVKSFKQ